MRRSGSPPLAGRQALTLAAAGLWRERQALEERGRETVWAWNRLELAYERAGTAY